MVLCVSFKLFPTFWLLSLAAIRSSHNNSEGERFITSIISGSLVNISCAVFVSSQCFLFPLILEYWRRHIWLELLNFIVFSNPKDFGPRRIFQYFDVKMLYFIIFNKKMSQQQTAVICEHITGFATRCTSASFFIASPFLGRGKKLKWEIFDQADRKGSPPFG